MVEQLSSLKEKLSSEFFQVWLSVDLVERLVELSDSNNQLYKSVLKMF